MTKAYQLAPVVALELRGSALVDEDPLGEKIDCGSGDERSRRV